MESENQTRTERYEELHKLDPQKVVRMHELEQRRAAIIPALNPAVLIITRSIEVILWLIAAMLAITVAVALAVLIAWLVRHF
jgi:hypothetical protein